MFAHKIVRNIHDPKLFANFGENIDKTIDYIKRSHKSLIFGFK